MIKDGCMEGVNEVYGMHNDPFVDEGKVNVCEGIIFAAVAGVKITIKGKGGHSSVPHEIKDPIATGAAIINALHSIHSRMIDSKENFVLAIT